MLRYHELAAFFFRMTLFT